MRSEEAPLVSRGGGCAVPSEDEGAREFKLSWTDAAQRRRFACDADHHEYVSADGRNAVAGPRESKARGIQKRTRKFLAEVLGGMLSD